MSLVPWTPEHDLFRKTVRDFVQKEIAPFSREWEEAGIFPRELFRPPRAWVERLFHVAQWTEMKSGGHFAAMEEPEALVEDVRTFFRGLR